MPLDASQQAIGTPSGAPIARGLLLALWAVLTVLTGLTVLTADIVDLVEFDSSISVPSASKSGPGLTKLIHHFFRAWHLFRAD